MFIIAWRYITPTLCTILPIIAVMGEIREPVSIVDKGYRVPGFARAIGWFIGVAGMIPIVWWALKHQQSEVIPVDGDPAERSSGPTGAGARWRARNKAMEGAGVVALPPLRDGGGGAIEVQSPMVRAI